MRKPIIYTAAKVHHGPMLREFAARHSGLAEFNSSWIRMENLDDSNETMCRQGWHTNIEEVKNCDYLLVWGEQSDAQSGTLVEIGAALASNKSVILSGWNERWKTWRFHGLVHVGELRTPEDGLLYILNHFNGPGPR